MELEKRLRNRKDMEAELLSLTASMSDVLHVGHAEAQQLAEAIQLTATEAEQVCLSLLGHMAHSADKVLCYCLWRLLHRYPNEFGT